MLFKSLALAALTATPAYGAGCYPAWSSGSDYSTGSYVSATITTTTTSTANDGTVTETTTSETKNFKCTSGSEPSLSHCPSYDPSNAVEQAAAWSDEGVCSGTATVTDEPTPAPTTSPTAAPSAAPTLKPTPARWTSEGCPEQWTSGASYAGGDLVELGGNVYSCSTAVGANLWCGSDAYKPGDSEAWEEAWTLLGSCDGTIAPTTAPVYVTLADAGGCPPDFDESTVYEAGDKVGVNGLVYECKSWPESAHCSQTGFEPDGAESSTAWTVLGHCEGTIAPTTSPVYVSLADAGGCPPAFDESSTYEAGDKVEVNGLIYECMSWPESAHCSQTGYEPAGDYSTEAWTVLGHCDGTIAPTTSPNFSSLAEVGDGCPKAYDDSTAYEAGDLVSVNSVVFECKAWGAGGEYCNSGSNFAPGTDNGNLGWIKKGYCDGTIAPTTAPIAYTPVEKCRWYNGTQPITIEVWSAADISTYVAGTRVRKGTTIYKCKSFPFSLWCKTSGYEPEVGTAWTDSWSMAGECNDALAPTTSPSASPTGAPSSAPSSQPSSMPSESPSSQPSSQPSESPSSQPSAQPSSQPSTSSQPSSKPTVSPSDGP